LRLGEEARSRRLVTVELIPDRVNPSELSLLRGRVSAITIPALRNGSHDPSYPTTFKVTPQQRSIASALIVKRTGIEAVPSLTCRDCRGEDLATISRLVEDGLENLLVVYGDPSGSDRDLYEFTRTDHLIRQVASESNGNPPSIGTITNQYARNPEREISRTLARVDAGAEFVLTNTTFDQDRVLQHRDNLRSAGLDVPLLIQVSIPQNLENLLFVSQKFGIPVSERLKGKLQRHESAGIDVAAEAFESLRLEANGIHFSYLLRKRSPIPTYCRLLDRIGERLPLTVSAQAPRASLQRP
jgi:5,10-methylenetetrahydrofolate reductase